MKNMTKLTNLILEYGDAQANFASNGEIFGSPGYKEDQRRYLLACKALQSYVCGIQGEEEFLVFDEHAQRLLRELETEK